MKGHEITYELKKNGVKVSDLAKSLDVKQPTVTQVIYRIRAIPRIRTAISIAIGKPVSEIWPDKEEAA